MKKSTKILIWSGVILAIGLGGYWVYTNAQKKKQEEAAANKRADLMRDIGNVIGGIFD